MVNLGQEVGQLDEVVIEEGGGRPERAEGAVGALVELVPVYLLTYVSAMVTVPSFLSQILSG